jgi:hypothetical protein
MADNLPTQLQQINIVEISGQPASNGFPTQPALVTTAELLSAAVNVSSSGNNTLIAGSNGLKLRVYRAALVFTSAVSATFQDGDSTALTGPMSLTADASITLDFESQPWFTASAGNDFVLNLSGPCNVAGIIYYTQM